MTIKDAKADVQHGEWLPMLAQIGISQQDANRYMAIARNLKSPKFGDLPPSATALYELSRLTPEAIEHGIGGPVLSGSALLGAMGLFALTASRSCPVRRGSTTL